MHDMIRELLKSVFPYFAFGNVVKGFGRGGKQLGCPTANFSQTVVDNLPSDFPCGVYYGWGSVENGPVHGMVMSIGWNPHFKNTKKTMEVHLLHDFSQDFYGSLLKVIVIGYIREMESYSSLEELKNAISSDMEQGTESLKSKAALTLKSHKFFQKDGEYNLENKSSTTNFVNCSKV